MSNVTYRLKNPVSVNSVKHNTLTLTAPTIENIDDVRELEAISLSSLRASMKDLVSLSKNDGKKNTSRGDEKINYSMVKMGLGTNLESNKQFDKTLDNLIFSTTQAVMSGALGFLRTGSGHEIWDALSIADRKNLSKVYFDAFIDPSFG